MLALTSRPPTASSSRRSRSSLNRAAMWARGSSGRYTSRIPTSRTASGSPSQADDTGVPSRVGVNPRGTENRTQQLERLAAGKAAELDPVHPLQGGQRAAARHQRRGADRPGQQRTDLGLVRRVVENDQYAS